MTITSDLQEMTDHCGDVSDHDCLGAIYGAEKPVYAGSGGPTCVIRSRANPATTTLTGWNRPPCSTRRRNRHRASFSESQLQWENCAGQSISVKEAGSTSLWQLDDVKAEDILISQMSTQKDAGGWACQHALSVVSNLTVEAFACGYSIHAEAATMANKMIANATKE